MNPNEEKKSELATTIHENIVYVRTQTSNSDILPEEIYTKIQDVNSLTVELAAIFKTDLNICADLGAQLNDPFDVMIVTHPDGETNQDLLKRLIHGVNLYNRLFLVSGANNDLFKEILHTEDKKQYRDLVKQGRICIIKMGENLGPSIARNLVAHLSEAEHFICVDDDGLVSVEELVLLSNSIKAHGAQMVRGRVSPFDSSKETPPHYYKGDNICLSFADIEGITAWKTNLVREHMFDPFLYGHEGVELTIRVSHAYAPEAFLYDPCACLLHDYATPEKIESKEKRNKDMYGYLQSKNPDHQSQRQLFYKYEQDISHRSFISGRRMTRDVLLPTVNSSSNMISVITTAFNSAEFIEDYADAWRRQTDGAFHITFVDDGSTDDTLDLARKYLKGLPHTIVELEHKGRGAALNSALEDHDYDWCIIADADDVPMPDRVEMARRAISTYPTKTVFGFTIFDRNTFCRGSRPIISRLQPIEPRFLVGMPCPFPSIVFNASALNLKFSEELPSGIDYDWLFRNFEAGNISGFCFPYNVCFYRVHDGQITHKFRKDQIKKSLEHTAALHKRIIGFDATHQSMKFFLGWNKISQEHQLNGLFNYMSLLMEKFSKSDMRNFAQDFEKLCSELHFFYETRFLREKLGWNRQKHKDYKDAYISSEEGINNIAAEMETLRQKLQLNVSARSALAALLEKEGK